MTRHDVPELTQPRSKPGKKSLCKRITVEIREDCVLLVVSKAGLHVVASMESCRNTYLMGVGLCVQHCPKTEAHDNLKKEKKQAMAVDRMDELVFTRD